MKTKTLSLLFPLLALLICTSCSDDNATNAHSPVFESLTLSPSVVHCSDTVTGHVAYRDAGKNIYSSDYQYTITDGHSAANKQWRVTDPTKSQPVFGFHAPDSAGTYTVTFRATKIRYSTGGPNGELYGSANTVTATLVVTE